MNAGSIRRAVALVTLVLAVGLASNQGSGATSGSSPVRTVRGELVEVMLAGMPPIIVLKAQRADGTQLIVGATLDTHTVITRHGEAATMAALKTGETVSLVYSKGRDGFTARSIDIR